MSITANEYQTEALKTASYDSKYEILYPALGLGGEAGEVMNKVKEIIDSNMKNIIIN